MLAKLHKQHGTNRNYLKPKSDMNSSFGLNHFAGVVFYDTRGKRTQFIHTNGRSHALTGILVSVFSPYFGDFGP